MGNAAQATAAEREAVRVAARGFELDRYLAALLAPRHVRDDLIAVAATMGEIARVPSLVTEPMMGEVRLRWWRDALAPDAGPSGHPVADAMRRAIARHELPHDLVMGIADARIADLYADPVSDAGVLDAYLLGIEAAGFELAARVLDVSPDAPTRALAADAGRAVGLTRLLIDLPRLRQRGRDPFPQVEDATDTIARYSAEARQALARVRARLHLFPPALADAVLPVALVEPYLRALQRPGFDPWTMAGEIAPLTRVTRLWWAHWRRAV